MSSPTLEAALPPNIDRGPELLAIFWVEIGIQTLVVVLRLYVRRALRILGWDDWTMLAAHVLSVVSISLASAFVLSGGGRHIYYVPESQWGQAMKLNLLSQSFDTVTLAFGKLSIVFLLLRLMGTVSRWRKWMMYLVTALYAILAVLNIIFTYVQCRPARALWEHVADAKCWNPNIQTDFLVAASAYSAFSDCFLALVPITFIWSLQMNLNKKIGLCILLGLGLFCGISATIKTIQIRDLIKREDITWAAFSVYIWASIEVFLNITCGSIPTLSPLYDKLVRGKPLRPSNAKAYRMGTPSQGFSNGERTHFPYGYKKSEWRHEVLEESSIGVDRTISVSTHAQ